MSARRAPAQRCRRSAADATFGRASCASREGTSDQMAHVSSIPDTSALTIRRVSISAGQHFSLSALCASARSFPSERTQMSVEGRRNAESTARARVAGLLNCRAPRRRRNRTRRTSGRRLRSGYPGAHEVTRLVLLPSGPDTVHGAPLPGTRPSTPAAPVSTEPGSRLGRGSRPC
jgi:hypothetical protein